MRFGSTAKVLLKCKLKYYRISECIPTHGHLSPSICRVLSASLPPRGIDTCCCKSKTPGRPGRHCLRMTAAGMSAFSVPWPADVAGLCQYVHTHPDLNFIQRRETGGTAAASIARPSFSVLRIFTACDATRLWVVEKKQEQLQKDILRPLAPTAGIMLQLSSPCEPDQLLASWL